MNDTYILCTVAGTTYAVRTADVQHIEMLEEIAPVPNAPPFVDGVVFSRGTVVPVLNLRARFGFPRAPVDLQTRLLVVRAGERTLGLLVDAAREFATIAAEAVQPPHEAMAAGGRRSVAGVANLGAGRLVLILDVGEIANLEQAAVPA